MTGRRTNLFFYFYQFVLLDDSIYLFYPNYHLVEIKTNKCIQTKLNIQLKTN